MAQEQDIAASLQRNRNDLKQIDQKQLEKDKLSDRLFHSGSQAKVLGVT